MRAELREVNRNEFMYSTARGLFFDGNDAYAVEVYDVGGSEEIDVKLYTQEQEEFTATLLNQPSIHGTGMNESLSLLDEEPELPETDTEIEAFARYALQEETTQGLEYTGPRELEDLEF